MRLGKLKTEKQRKLVALQDVLPPHEHLARRLALDVRADDKLRQHVTTGDELVTNDRTRQIRVVSSGIINHKKPCNHQYPRVDVRNVLTLDEVEETLLLPTIGSTLIRTSNSGGGVCFHNVGWRTYDFLVVTILSSRTSISSVSVLNERADERPCTLSLKIASWGCVHHSHRPTLPTTSSLAPYSQRV